MHVIAFFGEKNDPKIHFQNSRVLQSTAKISEFPSCTNPTCKISQLSALLCFVTVLTESLDSNRRYKRASLFSSQTRKPWSRGWATCNACESRGPSSAVAIPCGDRIHQCSIRRARRCIPIDRVRMWPRPPRSYVRRSKTSSDRLYGRYKVPARTRELTSPSSPSSCLPMKGTYSTISKIVEFSVAASSVFSNRILREFWRHLSV